LLLPSDIGITFTGSHHLMVSLCSRKLQHREKENAMEQHSQVSHSNVSQLIAMLAG
jgi:hypothetical protein